jgi:hypothetical protein
MFSIQKTKYPKLDLVKGNIFNIIHYIKAFVIHYNFTLIIL